MLSPLPVTREYSLTPGVVPSSAAAARSQGRDEGGSPAGLGPVGDEESPDDRLNRLCSRNMRHMPGGLGTVEVAVGGFRDRLWSARTHTTNST